MAYRARGGGGGDRPRPKSRTVTTKLHVAGLPETCKRRTLMEYFEPYGEVVECDIVKNYAFVHYPTATEAKAAVDALNGVEFLGKRLTVEFSHSKVRQKPGMGDANECFRCGGEGHWSRDCPSKREDEYPPLRGGRPYPPADPYARRRDPYADEEFYRDRYPPPLPRYRYDPYRRPPPPREYYRDPYGDPYARPPPEYYARARSPLGYRDPYDPYERRYPSAPVEHAGGRAALPTSLPAGRLGAGTMPAGRRPPPMGAF